MNWNALFAERTTLMRRSAVRELLKLTAQPGMISFAGGLPAPELFPVEAIQRATEAVLRRRAANALQYSETEGIAPLREWIAAKFSRPEVEVRRENVMIVSGSQQALDLIGKVFLDSGDQVLVENPTYLAMLSAWRPMGVRFVSVAADADGLCVGDLRPELTKQAKLLYFNPNFQNPQGSTLSLARRQTLVTLARATGLALVEDDPYGELRYEGERLPDVWELDARLAPRTTLESHVIHLGTFSKVLAPGLRVGWVIAPAPVIDKLVQAKQAADLHTSTLCQHIVYELLQEGVLDWQLPRLLREYRERRDAMFAALTTHFPSAISWTHPRGGMFLLVRLPEQMNAAALLPAALERQVAFVPGDDFHADGRGQNSLRLNFSNATPERIVEGIKRLGELLHENRSGCVCPGQLPTR